MNAKDLNEAFAGLFIAIAREFGIKEFFLPNVFTNGTPIELTRIVENLEWAEDMVKSGPAVRSLSRMPKDAMPKA